MTAFAFEEAAGPFRGPVAGLAWDGERLLLSLPAESRLASYDPNGGKVETFRPYTGRTTGIAFGADGRLYGCQSSSRRIVCFEADASTTVPCERLEGRIHNHPADLSVDTSGRIWFSDRSGRAVSELVPALDHASVLVLKRDATRTWRLRRATTDTQAPGALQVSPDGSSLYVAENPSGKGSIRELRRYPIGKDGRLGSPELLLCFAIDHRGPHPGVTALAVAADGTLLAGIGAPTGASPSLWLLSPDGLPLASQPLPETAASCAFGGPEVTDLYIGTTGGRLLKATGTGLKGWPPFRAAPPGIIGRPL